ncbi:MAG: hypothetical protein R3A13_10040 [Bdellovibrionota bacterium]
MGMFDEPVVGREGRFSRAVAELERQILADANKLMLTVIWGLVDVSADLELKVSELQDRIKKSIPENLKELLGEIEVIGVDPEGQLVLRFSVSDSRVNQWYLLNPDLFIEEAYVDPSTTPSSQHAVTVSTISKPHVPEAKRHETVSSPVNIVFKEESTAPYGFNIYFQFENPQVKHELLVNLDNRFNAPVSKKINRESFKEQDAIQKLNLGVVEVGVQKRQLIIMQNQGLSAAGVRERFTFLKELVINEVRKGYADWQVTAQRKGPTY